jgi:tetratricopeptide (TPR) repeat protein
VLRRIDRALVREPNDRDLIQLRSLTELAIGDFKAAFDDAMTVLAQEDVWSWSTLRSLYHSADEYTALYRKLEDRVIADPNALQLRVLLAYHNLMLGHRDAARRHFEKVLALDPSNEVARRLASAEQPPLPRDSAQLPPAPPTSNPPLKPIPTRRRPPTNAQSGSGGIAIDLGQPVPATGANPKPAPTDARPN